MSPNLKSCTQFPLVIEAKLATEIKSGRVKGPFSAPPLPNLQVSPIGLVPKKTPNQYRLIHHLSYPKGKSVNDFIDHNFSTVHYASFDDAVAAVLLLGKGCLMAKTDIDNAFRLVPIHPLDHDLLGFSFNNNFYYDTCLPMGSSSSCFIFECFSSGLQWIAQERLGIQHMVHILDDFLILGPANSSVCQLNLQRFLQLCSSLGVPIKLEKTESARQVITFMGLELDSSVMEARLPADKLEKLRTILDKYCKSRKIKLKDLQSLLGLLNFCCNVVLPGRAFLRRLTDLTKKVSCPSHRITLNKESRRDIVAWQTFIRHFNGKQLLLSQRWVTDTSLHLFTDASGTLGFGAVFGTHWLYGSWPKEMFELNITFKELLPIVVAVNIWGPYLKNKCLVLHSDNLAVVHIVNKQSSKDPLIMHLVRKLVITCMSFNILVKSTHIPGKTNVLADFLSRLQIDKFREVARHMDKSPTAIPEELLHLP